METVQFKTKIKNGVIAIPAKYKDKVNENVRVILIPDEEKKEGLDIIDELMAHPLNIKGFKPFTREEANARK